MTLPSPSRRGRPRRPSARTVADLRDLVELFDGVVPLHEARRVLGRSATAAERKAVGVRLVGDALVSPTLAPPEPRSFDGVAAGVAAVHAPADQRVQDAARRGPNPGVRRGAGSPGVQAEGVTAGETAPFPRGGLPGSVGVSSTGARCVSSVEGS